MDLFQADERTIRIADGAYVLKAFALPNAAHLLADLQRLLSIAPPRHMQTPMGRTMSAAISNCGTLGWVSDRQGYRYETRNSANQAPWPSLPKSFQVLAHDAAATAGYADFVPDACIINRYQVGARMGLHQDKDEQDFNQPIVSVSLGIPAVFQFGGLSRQGKVTHIPLAHGDVVVWGGESRLAFHGIKPLQPAHHPDLGAIRYNLTFRKAG